MLHLRHVNGKRGGLIIRKLDDHSGPQLDKRDREDQSSQSGPKHMRMTQRTVIVKSKRGEISKEYDNTITFYDLYEDLIREQFIYHDNSYVIFLDNDHSKFLCPGFHYPLNETIEGEGPLILTELKRTDLEREINQLQNLHDQIKIIAEKKKLQNLLNRAEKQLNDLYQLKNVMGLHRAVKDDIQVGPSDNMRKWWENLFNNLFILDPICVNTVKNYIPVDQILEMRIGSSIPNRSRTLLLLPFWISKLKNWVNAPQGLEPKENSEPKLPKGLNIPIETEIWFRDQVKAGNSFQPPSPVIDEDTLPCAEPGNLQTNFQLGSLDGQFKNCFLLKRIFLVKEEPKVTYYFRDIDKYLHYLHTTNIDPIVDPAFLTEVPMAFYHLLLSLATLPREDRGVISVIEWDDINKGEVYRPMTGVRGIAPAGIVAGGLHREWFNEDFTKFSCTYQNLTFLPDVFERFPTLIEFNCSNNRLLTLPDSIGNLSNLEYFDCSYNDLTILPDSIGNLLNLEELYCNANRLTILPDSIGNLSNLERFQCNNNLLTILPDSIGNLKNLERFDCSYNLLTILPDSIGNLKNLEELYCDVNRLTILPDSIGNLSNLKIFNCSHNSLVELPSSLGNLINLNISLLQNQFPSFYYRLSWAELAKTLRDRTSLPDSWFNEDFTEFSCMQLGLKSLPDSFDQYPNLKSIDCSNNELSYLPASIVNLSKLESLNCNQNILTELPDRFGDLLNLKNFYCSSNQLTYFPISFSRLKNLELFICSVNDLSELPDIFDNLLNLAHFNCSFNKLTSLPISMSNLLNLRYFNCYHNLFTEFPKFIGDLKSLEYFNCSNNKLTKLPNSIGNLLNLIEFNCSYNHLVELPSSLGKLIHLDIKLYDNQFPSFYYKLSWPELAKHLRWRGNEEPSSFRFFF